MSGWMKNFLPPRPAAVHGGLAINRMRVSHPTLELLQEDLTIVDLRDSAAYELIVEEGRTEALLEILLQIGGGRFGPPAAEVQASLNAIDDADRLYRMSARVLDVENWQELLDTP